MLKRFFDKITRGSLRFRWVTVAISVVLLVAGVLALAQFNQELIPAVEFPQSVVLAFYPGATPEQVLEDVTIPIEDAVSEIEDVVYVESNTGAGFSAIIISSDYGIDQDALRDEIQTTVSSLDFPEEVETPELLAFSLSDLPVARISASSSDLTLVELKQLVESEIVPQLEAIEDVAQVSVSGGQELPDTPKIDEGKALAQAEEPTPESRATATPTEEPTATPTTEPSPSPVPTATATPEAEPTKELELTVEVPVVSTHPLPLPESWVQAAAAAGITLRTTADLTVELLEGLLAYAPDMLDEFTPEILLALPLESLAVLPEDYMAGLDPELQAILQARLEELTQGSTDEAPGEPPILPDSWLKMAKETGDQLPFELHSAADLLDNAMGMGVAELLNLMVSSGMLPDPGALLGDLTPEIMSWWAGQDPEFLASLSADTVALLSEEVLAIFPADLMAGTESGEPEEEGAVDESPSLPDSWLALAEEAGDELPFALETAADLQENPLEMGVAEMINLLVGSGMLPDPATLLGDLTPEIMSWWAEQDPEFLASLSPDTVAGLSDDVLAIFPEDVLAEIETAQAEAEVISADAPLLPDSWTGPDSPFESGSTAADLLNNPFGLDAAGLLNMSVQQNPEALMELSPEVILWLDEQDEAFLPGLEAGTLRLFSSDVLSALPEPFLDTLDTDLQDELAGLATGTVEAFLPTATINRTNGRPSLTLSIYKKSEANTVSVSHAVYDLLDEIEAENGGLRFDVAFEQASFIEESIGGVAREGGLGALFAVLVILLFLSGYVNGRYRLSWRSTLVTGVSIPLSVMMGFALMRWLPSAGNALLGPLVESYGDAIVVGPVLEFLLTLFPTSITLNIMTLSGMTVAVGRVVDDSIVVLENIYRHIQRGKDPRQSVIDGTRDVAIPIFASTVTTVVVFLPIGLMGGLIGNFFLPFGMTVTYALGSSFIVAITIVPVLAYLFIRKEHLPAEPEETALQRIYTPFLKWALGHRVWTLIIAAVIFMGSVWLLAQRPQTFIPDFGEPTINVYVDLGNGTTMAETDAQVVEFESVLSDIEGVDVYQSQIGSSGGMESLMFASGIDQAAANVQISVGSSEELERLTVDVRAAAEDVFGAQYVAVSAGGLTSSGMGGFDLVVTGPPEKLAELDTDVLSVLATVEGLVNVTSNLVDGDMIVRVDGQPAIQYAGEIETEDTMGVLADGKAAVEALGLPDGVTVSEGFRASIQTEGFQQSSQALLIAIVVVYVVMVATFNSLAHPFVILFSLPLALVGTALGLWITDKVVGISALVGLMMLVGIVVTNAIVLIDRVRINRRERGMGIYDALVEAGRTRLRPILMTAIAAILALVPLGLGLTEGALIASDLAVVVIGGLTTSTLLTLLVVPVAYSIVESFLRRFRRSKGV
jgi:HAE1 family hydrophobic/amphiphilic exporter-1